MVSAWWQEQQAAGLRYPLFSTDCPKKTIISCITGAWVAMGTHAAPMEETSNAALTAGYDEAAESFNVIDGRKRVVCDGKLDGVCTVAGKTLVRQQADGPLTRELRGDQPFVFVTKGLRNTGASGLDVPKAVPLASSMGLGKPANEPLVMGTGGLLDPDETFWPNGPSRDLLKQHRRFQPYPGIGPER